MHRDWHPLGTHRTPTSPAGQLHKDTHTPHPCTRGPGTSVSHSGTLVAWASGLTSGLSRPCHLPQQCSLSLPCPALSVHVTRSPLQTRNPGPRVCSSVERMYVKHLFCIRRYGCRGEHRTGPSWTARAGTGVSKGHLREAGLGPGGTRGSTARWQAGAPGLRFS